MLSPAVKQTWIFAAVWMHMFGQGMSLSYISILLKAVLDKEGDIQSDLYTGSWTASVGGISVLPGFWAASFLMASYGRRLSHAILLVPAIMSWAFIYFGYDIYLLIIGRAISGFSAGGLHLLECVVIGEYTSPQNRGVFVTLKTAAACIGATVMHILANLLDWRTISLIVPVPQIFSLLITLTWPESPSWLVLKKKYSEAEKSFYWLRGRSKETKNEIDHLMSAQRQRSSHQATSSNVIKNSKTFLMQFTQKDFLKPAILILFSKVLLEASARTILPAFAMQIIDQVTGDKSHSLYYTFGMDIVVTISSISAFILFKLLKRRTLLFSSGFSAVFVIYAACAYIFLVSQNVLSNDRTYTPITLFAVFFGLCNIACTHMPFLLMGEIVPLVYREAGICISGLISSICVFTAMQFTPYLLISAKVYGTFTILGSIMAICLIALWFILPETKDRTLQEIEDEFVHGKKNNIKYNDEANLEMITSDKT